MLQVARLAPGVLGDATPRVVEFVRSQLTAEGGGAAGGAGSVEPTSAIARLRVRKAKGFRALFKK